MVESSSTYSARITSVTENRIRLHLVQQFEVPKLKPLSASTINLLSKSTSTFKHAPH